jgi:predicted heme/steroid binding protein
MSIRVTDTSGKTLSLSMAILRYFVETASWCLFCLGHVVACFTDKRQAVHDLVADSIVVKGEVTDVRVAEAWVGTLQRLFGAGQDVFEKFSSEVPRASKKTRYDELERIFELWKKGALTEEEYTHLKRQLLADKSRGNE